MNHTWECPICGVVNQTEPTEVRGTRCGGCMWHVVESAWIMQAVPAWMAQDGQAVVMAENVWIVGEDVWRMDGNPDVTCNPVNMWVMVCVVNDTQNPITARAMAMRDPVPAQMAVRTDLTQWIQESWERGIPSN